MQTLQYESTRESEPAKPRPVWVWFVVVAYGLIVAGLIALATLVPLSGGRDEWTLTLTFLATVVVLILCGVSLIAVPVRAARRRPMTRRALWIPVLASGLLVGGLVFGAAIALFELFKVDEFYLDPVTLNCVLAAGIGGACVWGAWSVVFMLMSARPGPQRIANALHRWILAGSVLELLVAVPTHVMVRRRDECCAGIATGLGICIGVAVMIVAFGPSVALLYYRRWNDKTGKRGEPQRRRDAEARLNSEPPLAAEALKE